MVSPVLTPTSSLPDQPAQPQSDSAVGASPFDRMEAELKALQQQALTTQLSIKRLQAREASNPYSAILADLPAAPAIDGTLMGTASVLLVATALVWWYLWHRPQTRLTDTVHTAMPDIAPTRPHEPMQQPAAVMEAPQAPLSSPYAQRDPAVGFDSEAAASEVIRVRKSLADKREARAQMSDREEQAEEEAKPDPGEDSTTSVRAWLDRHASGPPDEVTPVPPRAREEFVDPWSQPGEAQPGAPAPLMDDDIDFSLPLEAFEMEPASAFTPAPETEPEPEPEPEAGHDYATTLALAQESAALELWPEARELAIEVLESDDDTLVSQSQDLLERLNQLELDRDPQTRPLDDAGPR
jgi:hypothetical protein